MERGRKNDVLHQARFNAAMNADAYQALGGLTAKALSRDRGSWFGSVVGLLNHILVTDIHWLARFRALDSAAPALADGRLDSLGLDWAPRSDDLAELSEMRSLADRLMLEWFEQFDEEKYDEAFSYVDSRGETRNAVASGAFAFLFHHQAYHRGQLSQILDEIGLPHSFADNGRFLDEF